MVILQGVFSDFFRVIADIFHYAYHEIDRIIVQECHQPFDCLIGIDGTFYELAVKLAQDIFGCQIQPGVGFVLDLFDCFCGHGRTGKHIGV